MIDIENAIEDLGQTFQQEMLEEGELEEYQEIMTELVNGDRHRWNICRSLENVGNGTVKLYIEKDLRTILDDETYALVEAIFHWNIDGENLINEDEEDDEDEETYL